MTSPLEQCRDALRDVALDLAVAQQAELTASLGALLPHKHAAAARDRAAIESALAAAEAALAAQTDIAEKLKDPVLVHAAMLRGEIAKPDIRDMLHAYGADALARWDAALAAQSEPVACVTECEACFTPDACQLRGKCDHYAAEQLRVKKAPLYAAPVAAQGWQPIETAPEDMAEPVVVRWADSEGEEARKFDYKEDGCWIDWHDYAENVRIIGGHGVSETPPYEHWMPLPAAPKEPA